MKRHWTAEELQTHWKLLPPEKKLVTHHESRHTQLGFAILLKFFGSSGFSGIIVQTPSAGVSESSRSCGNQTPRD